MTRHSDAVAPLRSKSSVGAWFARHGRTSAAALRRLTAQPFASLMIVLVIGVTLAIPAALNLVISNANAVSAGWDNALDFSVYLRQDLSEADARALAELIGQRADVESVQLVTADEALAEFRARSGFGAALEQLTSNPLPHTLIVRPAATNTAVSMGLLHEELDNLPETEAVQVDTEWVQRFHAILDIVRRAIALGAGLFAIAIVVIIGNTIRLDIQNRRDEIEVTKLIGASNAFVRRPFLWSGFWYGLLGGLLAIGLVQYGLFLLAGPVSRLAGLYASEIRIINLAAAEMLGVVGIGVALGLTGSWFASARHMRAIEPR
ncbi:MAG: permease-like cell division protein FtsX [Woeseiaceae bacterium]|nr:permease-like cell division protein FtsX [Woeseiaceae bacterium]